MLLPIIWIIFGIWFYKSAQEAKAKPWHWVAIGLAAPTALFLIFAIIFSFYSTHLQSLGAEWNHRMIVERSLTIFSLVATLLFAIFLRFYMVKRVPFRLPPETNVTSHE